MQSYAEYLNEIGEARGEARGEILGERRAVLRLGTSLLGPPEANVLTRLETIQSLEVLDELVLRVVKVNSWDELLRDL